MHDKLLQRAIPADVAREVLDDYERLGFVDDSRLAANLVSSVEFRPRSRTVVARELAAKGVRPEVVEAATAALDHESELAAALALARRRAAALQRVSPQVARRRLAGALARRGYSPEVVFAVVKQAVDDRGTMDS